MYCKQCARPLKENARFCEYCGTPCVGNTAQTQPTGTIPASQGEQPASAAQPQGAASAQQTPIAPPAAAKTKSRKKILVIVLCVIAGLFLLMLGSCAALVVLGSSSSSAPSSVVSSTPAPSSPSVSSQEAPTTPSTPVVNYFDTHGNATVDLFLVPSETEFVAALSQEGYVTDIAPEQADKVSNALTYKRIYAGDLPSADKSADATQNESPVIWFSSWMIVHGYSDLATWLDAQNLTVTESFLGQDDKGNAVAARKFINDGRELMLVSQLNWVDGTDMMVSLDIYSREAFDNQETLGLDLPTAAGNTFESYFTYLTERYAIPSAPAQVQQSETLVVADGYQYSYPDYWKGRVEVSIDGAKTVVYVKGHPDTVLITSEYSDTLLPTGDIGGGAFLTLEANGGYLQFNVTRWAYTTWLSAQPKFGKPLSAEEQALAAEAIDLETGGAVSYDDCVSSSAIEGVGTRETEAYLLSAINDSTVEANTPVVQMWISGLTK